MLALKYTAKVSDVFLYYKDEKKELNKLWSSTVWEKKTWLKWVALNLGIYYINIATHHTIDLKSCSCD